MQLCLVSPPCTHSNTKLHKNPSTLSVKLIRHTNEVKTPSTATNPIVVIQHKEHYYVLDGNHRLAYAKECGHAEISAWILAPDDQHLVYDKTTSCIEDWVAGKKSFEELIDSAVTAYDELVKSHSEYA